MKNTTLKIIYLLDIPHYLLQYLLLTKWFLIYLNAIFITHLQLQTSFIMLHLITWYWLVNYDSW